MNQVLLLMKKIAIIGNPIRIIRNLWHYRYLIQQMISRDLNQRYKGSYLGIFWSAINPLFMLVIYTFVFSVIFNARWKPEGEVRQGEFALTLYAGLIAFSFFSEVINRAPNIIVQYPNFVKKVVFPLEIHIPVIIGVAFINALISIGILLVGNLIFFHTIPLTALILPLLFVPLSLLTLGLGWFLAALGVYIRDVGQAVTIITQVLFFMTPIFFPTSSVPQEFQIVLNLNPLAFIVTGFRQILIWGEMFSLQTWIIWTLIFLILSILGYVWFMGTKKGFADVL